MRSVKNVLMLLPFSPVPPDFGGALRVFHIVRQVAKIHKVTVLTYSDRPEAELQSALGVHRVVTLKHSFFSRHRRVGQLLSNISRHSFFQLSVVTQQFQQAIDHISSREHFDVIHTEFTHLGPFRLPPNSRRIVDAHNVEYDNFRRMYETTKPGIKKYHYWLEYKKMKADELKLCAQSDMVLTTSARDKELFEKDIHARPIEVVPNGVDASYFVPSLETRVEPESLVFTGMMSYTPNTDGMEWFLEKILPEIQKSVPNVKMYVVGKSPTESIRKFANSNVVVTGTVDDVRPYVHKSAVFVVPLRMGGGTRLKIAEAFAMKKPMVSTRIGAEGIDVENGKHLLFADSETDFANAVVKLLKDENLKKHLSENAYTLMKEKYEWSVIGKTLERIYEN